MTRRFGFNGATTGSVDLLTDLRVAEETGYAALEIRDAKLEQYLEGGGSLQLLRRMFADAGVQALSLNALERATPAVGAEQTAATRAVEFAGP